MFIFIQLIALRLYPQHLDSRFPEEREAAKEILLSYFKHIAEISNSKLIQNANSFIAKNEAKIDPDVEISWIGEIHPQNQTKFKLGYYLFVETNNAITMLIVF